VFDVVIVGASIAGSATAIHLARQGYSVQLVDRASFPRRKACGEGLFSPGVAELAGLGVLSDLLPKACILSSIQFETRGQTVEAPLGGPNRPAIGIERHLLDDALLTAASVAGVDVCLGVRATGLVRDGRSFGAVLTADGDRQARVIVAADGLHSRLRTDAGIGINARPRRFGVSAHFRVHDHSRTPVEVHFRPGYEVYLTPVGGGLVNIALLLDRKTARMLGGRLHQGFQALVMESRALPSGSELIDAPLIAGPFPIQAERLWRDNLVLAGDAAGFYDGVSGDGMSIALVSARLLAAAIGGFLTDGSQHHFATYARARDKLAGNSTLLAKLTLALAAHPSIGARAVRNLARRPETFARLVAINQGESDMRSLRPRDLLALLLGV